MVKYERDCKYNCFINYSLLPQQTFIQYVAWIGHYVKAYRWWQSSPSKLNSEVTLLSRSPKPSNHPSALQGVHYSSSLSYFLSCKHINLLIILHSHVFIFINECSKRLRRTLYRVMIIQQEIKQIKSLTLRGLPSSGKEKPQRKGTWGGHGQNQPPCSCLFTHKTKGWIVIISVARGASEWLVHSQHIGFWIAVRECLCEFMLEIAINFFLNKMNSWELLKSSR